MNSELLSEMIFLAKPCRGNSENISNYYEIMITLKLPFKIYKQEKDGNTSKQKAKCLYQKAMPGSDQSFEVDKKKR